MKRGSMLRQVRGLGTLIPVDEARRMLPAATQAASNASSFGRRGSDAGPVRLSSPIRRLQSLSDAEQQLRVRSGILPACPRA